MEIVKYEHQEGQVCCRGVSIAEGEGFNSFMTKEVAVRLNDLEGAKEFESALRGLVSTGFEQKNLDTILKAKIPEERDWAVGEAMAEAYLARQHNITWPWNMERDKRTPKASLPGADLVGFQIHEDSARLVLGEVKTSGVANTPPGVMNGRSGMSHQIDNLVSNLSLVNQLLRWLFPRCKGTQCEKYFKVAVSLFIKSGNKNISLFGVLIRDTTPNKLDLYARVTFLAKKLQEPTTCHLIALYVPCSIADFPKRVGGGI